MEVESRPCSLQRWQTGDRFLGVELLTVELDSGEACTPYAREWEREIRAELLLLLRENIGGGEISGRARRNC